MSLRLEPCSYDELVRRGKRSRMIPEDFDGAMDEQFSSASESVADALRLDEDTMYALLGLEYTIASMPQPLLADMEILGQFRQDENLQTFRREGFCPVEQSSSGVTLVVVGYPFSPSVLDEVERIVGSRVELVLGSDRTLGSIFARSVADFDAEAVLDVETADEGYFLGSEDEETMFPGLYGGGAADLLYAEEKKAPSSTTVHKTTGYVQDLGFLDMLQMMSQSRKTGSMYIANEEYGEIYIFFNEGEIVHCITEFENGEEGFYRIVGLTEGEFEIAMGPVEVERTINASVNALIMEGLRRFDEESAESMNDAGGGAEDSNSIF